LEKLANLALVDAACSVTIRRRGNNHVEDRIMRYRLCWLVFIILVLFWVFSASPIHRALGLSGDLRNFALPFALIGLLLVVVAAVTKGHPWQRVFFILTGAGAMGFQIALWINRALSGTVPNESFSYILFFYISPVAFLIGVLGSIISGLIGLRPRS
jgi:hypothetical protein